MLRSTQFFRRFFPQYLAGFALLGQISCSSVKPEPIAPSQDVQTELDKTEKQLASAKAEQVDVLAPANFKAARRDFNDAIETRNKGKDSEQVFKTLGTARTHLRRASESAEITRTGLARTLTARSAAVAAGAGRIKGDKLEDLDDKLKDVTESAETGNLEEIRQQDEKFSGQYLALELQAIKNEHLGPAHDRLIQAENEGAKKTAPRTYEAVEAQYRELDGFIASRRHDPSLAKRAADLNAQSERLVAITREAKKVDKTDAEAIVLQEEQRQRAADLTAQKLAVTASVLQGAQEKTSNLEQKANSLEQQAAFEKKFEEARAMFAQDEAIVYRQADSLTIRLKKPNFKSGDASINTQSFGLLKKVETVIRGFESPSVTIEGHTDSVGAKSTNMALSQARADAVANYLVAQGIPQGSLSTVGYGDEKPISSNKTRDGRAQNRRVDVIINSRRSSAAR